MGRHSQTTKRIETGRGVAGRHAVGRITHPAQTGSLAEQVGRGVAWSAANATVLRLGQFMMAIVIARLVSPTQFGVFVVALTVFTIIVNVSEIGVSSALVREPDRTAAIAPTVATIAITTSAVLATAMALCAPMLAHALGSDAATGAVRILALTVVVGGAGAVPAAILARDYRQKRVFAVDATVFVVSNGLLVLLALLGAGVLALAWSRVAGQIVSTLMYIALSPERYRPGFDRSEARRLLKFGLPLAGANLQSFTISNVDFIVIGRLRGARQLGLYNLAFNISLWPVNIFLAILNNVTLTTLSRVRTVRAELEAHLSAAMSSLAAASFPLSALCVALSGPLIDTVYGAKWSEAAPALAVLAIFGSTRVIVAPLADLLVALGYTKRLLLLQGVWLGVLLPAMIVCVRWHGIIGAGIAQTAVVVCVVLPSYLCAARAGAGIGLSWLASSVLPPLAAAAVAGTVAYIVAAQLSVAPLALIFGGLAGVSSYLLVLNVWLRALRTRLQELYGRKRTLPTPLAAAVVHESVEVDTTRVGTDAISARRLAPSAEGI